MSKQLSLNLQFQQEFRAIDVDGSGLITKKEFMNYYKTHKSFPKNTKRSVEWMFEVVDVDHSGKISFKEFAIFAEAKSQIDFKDKRWFERMIFRMMDTDKSNAIDADELKRLVQLLGLPSGDGDVQQLLNEIDTDGNGVVDLDEFLAVFSFADE